MIFKQVPVWSHSISEAAMEKFGSTAAGRAASSGNSTWRTITGACRDEALHRCGSMWGHSLQQMPLDIDRARMVRMIQNGYRMASVSDFTPGKCLRDWQSPKFIQVPDCGDPGFGHRDSKPTTYMCGHVHLYLPRWSIFSFLYPVCIVCFLYCLSPGSFQYLSESVHSFCVKFKSIFSYWIWARKPFHIKTTLPQSSLLSSPWSQNFWWGRPNLMLKTAKDIKIRISRNLGHD